MKKKCFFLNLCLLFTQTKFSNLNSALRILKKLREWAVRELSCERAELWGSWAVKRAELWRELRSESAELWRELSCEESWDVRELSCEESWAVRSELWRETRSKESWAVRAELWEWLVIQACIFPWDGCFHVAVGSFGWRSSTVICKARIADRNDCFAQVTCGMLKSHETLCFLAECASQRRSGEPCLCDGFGFRSWRARVVPIVSAARRRSLKVWMRCAIVFGDPVLLFLLEWLLSCCCWQLWLT